MLHTLREWLTAVVSVTLLLSLLRVLTPPGAVQSAASFAGGLALASVLLRPLSNLPLPDWDPAGYRAAVREEQAEAARSWTEALSAEVSARTEQAVFRAASERGLLLDVHVDVRADGNGVPLPWAVTLSGARDAGLERWIADALGIPRERQVWTDGVPAGEGKEADKAANPEAENPASRKG